MNICVFSQAISNPIDAWQTKDSLLTVSSSQIRAANRIFAEHSFLKSENTLLNNQIALLSETSQAMDCVIQSQRAQIAVLNDIIVKKDAMLTSGDSVIEILKKQIKAEQRDMKKFWCGVGAGAVVAGVLIAILK